MKSRLERHSNVSNFLESKPLDTIKKFYFLLHAIKENKCREHAEFINM